MPEGTVCNCDMNPEYITNVIRYKPGLPCERIALSPGQSGNDNLVHVVRYSCERYVLSTTNRSVRAVLPRLPSQCV